jgi:single-strand DNA-binding protein
LNRIILIGRLATDPELKYTPSGIAVTQFRLAVDRPMSAEARQNGQEKQADFISIVAWRQSAEFAANYLGKGRLVAVEGRLQVREYVTQDGQKRRDAEVVADNLKSLDKPKEGAENGGSYSAGAGRSDYSGGGGGRYEDEPAQVAPAPAAAPRAAASAPAPNRRPAAAAAPAGRYQPSDEDLDDPFADS